MIFLNENKEQMLIKIEKYQSDIKSMFKSSKDNLKQLYPDAKKISLIDIKKEDLLKIIYENDLSISKYVDMVSIKDMSKEELIANFSDIFSEKVSSSIIYTAKLSLIEKEEFNQLNNPIVYFSNKEEFTKPRVKEIINFAKQMKKTGINLNIKILSDFEKIDEKSKVAYFFTKEELKQLLYLDKKVSSIKLPNILFCEKMQFSNGKEDWNLEQVINANMKIDKYVEEIRRLNLTPFEAMIFIHKIASNFVYNNDKTVTADHSSTLVGVLNGDKIVCQGYATLVKAIVDRLQLKGLSAEINGFQCTKNDNSIYFHANNLIHINDEKYGVNGVYLEDSCWDCRNDINSQRRGLLHCLYPIQDISSIIKFKDIKTIHVKNAIESYYDNSGNLYYDVEYRDITTLQSTPISFETYKQGYSNVLEKQGKDNIPAKVSEEMAITKKRASIRFKNSSNCFYQENIKDKEREY